MAIDGNLPLFLENAGAQYNAREFRRFFERMMGYDVTATPGTGAGGVFRSGDLAVTQNGGGSGDQTCNVAIGAAYVDGSELSTQGGYFVYNDASVSVALTAADLTNPRKDIVGVRIRDSEYSGSVNDALIVVVTGTPAASPAEPTLPANFLTLALLDIPANDNQLGTGQITDRRRRMSALGGVTVCTSATRPATGLWAGQVIFETDTVYLQVYNGSAWVPVGGAAKAWTVIDQVTLGGTGALTFSNIDQTYTHLWVIGQVRGNVAAHDGDFYFRLNNDSGNNYDYNAVQGYNNTTQSAFGAQGGNVGMLAHGAHSTAAADRFTMVEMLLPDYRGAHHKNVKTQGGGATDSAATGVYTLTRTAHNNYRSNSAITQIDLLNSSSVNSFLTLSKVTLLGIRA